MLAVVTTGLVMSFYARGRISPGVEESMHNFWSMLTYVANTVIFFVSGLIIGDRALFDESIEVTVTTVVPEDACRQWWKRENTSVVLYLKRGGEGGNPLFPPLPPRSLRPLL